MRALRRVAVAAAVIAAFAFPQPASAHHGFDFVALESVPLMVAAGSTFGTSCVTRAFDPTTDLSRAPTATFDWGDGSPLEPGALVILSDVFFGGSFWIFCGQPHIYVDAGKFEVRIHIHRTDGITVTDIAHMTVAENDNVYTSGPDITAKVGDTVGGLIIRIHDPDPSGLSAANYAGSEISWGDGTPDTVADAVLVAPHEIELRATHVYTAPGDYFVSSLIHRSGALLDFSYGPRAHIAALTSPPSVTQHPVNLTVGGGQLASFSAAASGTPPPTVQWQVSTDGGATFADIGGATSPTYTFIAGEVDDEQRYRAVFTNSEGTATTDAALLRVDTQAPVFADMPGDMTVEATGPGGAFVGYTPPTASDDFTPVVVVSCLPPLGGFPLGQTDVVCTASDGYGNTATGGFSITVVDTTGPSLTTLVLDETAEATGPDGAHVSYGFQSANDLVDGPVPVACTPPPGSLFPLGLTVVECTATDSRGNSASYQVDILVEDTTPPVLADMPADTTLEATAPGGASFDFHPTATDLVDGAPPVLCTKPSGATFALGTTHVVCTSTDAHDNTSESSFDVTVVDTTAPTIAPHADVTAEATGPGGANVAYTVPAATDLVDGPVSVDCSPASGASFALGSTLVSCAAMDSRGNAGAVDFNVDVVDTTPPQLLLPGTIEVDAAGAGGTFVSYTATANDLVDGAVAVTCSPASGSLFAIGSTTVDCSSTDLHGNTANGSFTVLVLGAEALLEAEIAATEGVGPGGSFSSQLGGVVAAFQAGSSENACSKLKAYTNHVRAQIGKSITKEQAATLLANAARIAGVLHC